MSWHAAVAMEIAAEFEEWGAWELEQPFVLQLLANRAERERAACRDRARRKYYRDKSNPERWARRIASAERVRRRKVAAGDAHHRALGRARSRRTWLRMMADPARHAAYLARRRDWWRRNNPTDELTLVCDECGTRWQRERQRGPVPRYCGRRCAARVRQRIYRAKRRAG